MLPGGLAVFGGLLLILSANRIVTTFGAVLAALADDPAAAREVAAMAGVPAGHRVVSAFRIGRRPSDAAVPRARRELTELLV